MEGAEGTEETHLFSVPSAPATLSRTRTLSADGEAVSTRRVVRYHRRMAKHRDKILIVDDDQRFLASVARALRKEYVVLAASDREAAVRAVREEPDLALLDIRMNESDQQDRGGIEVLREFMKMNPQMPVVMFSAYGDVETAVECMRLGAVDFVQKSAGINELRQRLKIALAHANLSRKVTQLEERLQQLDPTEMMGDSPQITQVKQLLQMVANDGYVTVLIRGETGTGKELAARAIHRVGWRAKEPFVPVAVASLNISLVESELFGHEAGAFTGARERRIGFIEKAKRGVLFLDEVGDLPTEAQLKLLRFMEERKFSRVGNSDEIEVDVQILAATNRNLEEAIRQGRFREDLYFRLKSVQLFLPPLRERLDDITLLAHHFLSLLRKQGRAQVTEIDKEVLEKILQYPWPGNVRELKAVLERAVIYANYHGHYRLEKEDLPLEILSPSAIDSRKSPGGRMAEGGINLEKELARVELSYIEEALQLTEARKTEAWKLLGLNDRYALLRRSKILIKRHPSLAFEFPLVRKLYGKSATPQAES